MTNAHDFKFERLTGGASVELGAYAGKVILLVNVASACGFTPQYRELEQLFEAKSAQGLVVIGVPSNDFGRQEPGDEAQIDTFCKHSYGVTFPMTAKVEIAGAGRHPFFEWIRKELGDAALPKWNFHKFLIGRDGAILAAFAPSAGPLSPQVLAQIKSALAA
jgi:glutathione peroxidase